MLQVFEDKILPWCKENGLELLIMDNDPKLHSKAVCTFMKENGVQIYPRVGKNPWVNFVFPVIVGYVRTERRMVILHGATTACPPKQSLLNLSRFLK